MSDKSLGVINDSLILSWNLVNPIISDLILIKRKALNNIVFNLNDFSNIKERFEEIKEEKNEIYNKSSTGKKHNRRSAMSFSVHFKFKGINNQKNPEKNKSSSNVLSFGRITNSFGKIPYDRYQLFYKIEDEPY